MTATPVRVFYSYDERDGVFRDELETHLALLRRNNLIEGWHGRQVAAGQNWQEVIDQKLREADIILLLVSSSFLASDYLFGTELRLALDRHATGQARVVPIIIRPVDLANSELARLQPLPTNGRPVSIWADHDQAWVDVARGIRAVVETMRTTALDSPQGQYPAEQGAFSAGASATAAVDRGSTPSRNLPVHPPGAAESGDSPAAGQKIPTPASLRKTLNKAIVNEADFTAFCLDHFAQIHQRFTGGMERTTKTSLLLQLADRRAVLRALREDFPTASYEELIRYEEA